MGVEHVTAISPIAQTAFSTVYLSSSCRHVQIASNADVAFNRPKLSTALRRTIRSSTLLTSVVSIAWIKALIVFSVLKLIK